MADARARQRQTIDKFAGFLLPLLMLACAGWVCVLAVLNLRERRVELGLLRSLGHGSGLIAGLFIGKAVLVAALGATLGWAAGSALALHFGQQIFPVTVQAIRTEPFLLAQMLVGAVALVTTATVIPASMAVALDPAEVLREE
jgi:putative ABC transport system permease protein